MLFLFVFGLLVGSFINVITLRYQPSQNSEGTRILDPKIIGGRSHCPHCLETLSWYELIPIFSFLIQNGKCRNCHERISLQYPIVELISGFIFSIVPWYISNFSAVGEKLSIFDFQTINQLSGYELRISLIWVLIFTLFLVLSIIDLRHLIIPDQINLSLGVLGLILIFIENQYNRFNFLSGSFLRHYAAVFGFRENIWLNHLIAAFIGAAVFGLIIFLSRGKAMGWGDFKLIAALGLIFGWPDILMVMVLAFIIGALISIIFLIKKKKKIKDIIPFGPFLIIGATLTFFLGYEIINGYFNLFGLY